MRTHSYFCQNKNKMGFKKQKQKTKASVFTGKFQELVCSSCVSFSIYPSSPQSATETWTGVEFVDLETRLMQDVATEIQVLFLPWVPQNWQS